MDHTWVSIHAECAARRLRRKWRLTRPAAELHPATTHRAHAVALAVCSNWLNNALVGLLTPELVRLSPAGTFALFGAAAAGAGVWVWRGVEETKGRGLEDAQRSGGITIEHGGRGLADDAAQEPGLGRAGEDHQGENDEEARERILSDLLGMLGGSQPAHAAIDDRERDREEWSDEHRHTGNDERDRPGIPDATLA